MLCDLILQVISLCFCVATLHLVLLRARRQARKQQTQKPKQANPINFFMEFLLM